jgi:acetate kinase
MQVAVFDTAFLTTMPAAAYTYALPADLARKEGLRRYGAHGTSYRYLVDAAAKMLGRPAAELNMIIGHIGVHTSACAPVRCSSSSMRAHPIARQLRDDMSARVLSAQSRGWRQHVGS